MARSKGRWAPYVSVEQRRRKAERAVAKLRKTGHAVAPIMIAERQIAMTFWGRAWCDNLESYGDYESRLLRGRTYVRNGSVVDLQITPGRVTALVSGSELYNVVISIKETPHARWRTICQDCAGAIGSLVELLQGRLSNGVMERLCRQDSGLFPRPSDIRFSCSCLDYASMCKHVAAAMYGIGARLDQQPELLFRLRAVNESELVAGIDPALMLSKKGPAASRVLETNDLSALFELDMGTAEASAAGEPSDQAKMHRVSPERDVLASKAHALDPMTADPQRVPSIRATTQANRAVISTRSLTMPTVPQRKPAAKTNSTTVSGSKLSATKRESSRLDVPKQAVAAGDTMRTEQRKRQKRAVTSHQVTDSSAFTPGASGAPARSRGKR